MPKEENSTTLEVTDLDNMLRAVKHAHTRGAFTMEEAAQLFPVTQRVDLWLEAYKKQLEASQAPGFEPGQDKVDEAVTSKDTEKKSTKSTKKK